MGVAMAMLVSACGTTTLKVTRMKPAEINISGFEQIAVSDMRGPSGGLVADRISQALFNSGRFQVLDRENLNAILQEQQLSMSDYTDPAQAVQVGRMLGSAALVFGSVNRYDYEERSSKTDAMCEVKINGVDKMVPCIRYQRMGAWDVEVALRVVDTATGRVIAMRTFDEKASRSVAQKDEPPVRNWNPDDVFDQVVDTVVGRFMRMIAPYHETVQVALFADKALPGLEHGITLARAGNWQAAIDVFTDTVRQAERMPGLKPQTLARAHYDLAVAYGYSGRYEDAMAELDVAIRILPDRVFMQEQAKIAQFRRDDERLAEQTGLQSSRRVDIRMIRS
ncbi:MAG: hypothetical protein OEY97_09205 [Nitrospirota bacterium]|nr:hypothetical protein [Nitrospirota bacterium]